jgi:hypothetical protein
MVLRIPCPDHARALPARVWCTTTSSFAASHLSILDGWGARTTNEAPPMTTPAPKNPSRPAPAFCGLPCHGPAGIGRDRVSSQEEGQIQGPSSCTGRDTSTPAAAAPAQETPAQETPAPARPRRPRPPRPARPRARCPRNRRLPTPARGSCTSRRPAGSRRRQPPAQAQRGQTARARSVSPDHVVLG